MRVSVVAEMPGAVPVECGGMHNLRRFCVDVTIAWLQHGLRSDARVVLPRRRPHFLLPHLPFQTLCPCPGKVSQGRDLYPSGLVLSCTRFVRSGVFCSTVIPEPLRVCRMAAPSSLQEAQVIASKQRILWDHIDVWCGR
jgi:hypothetical protein